MSTGRSAQIPRGTVTAAWLAAVLADAGERFDGRAFLASHELTPDDLEGPDARVPTAVIVAAWREVPVVLDDDAYGLRVALRAPIGSYFMLEQLCEACPTLGDALIAGARYYQSMSDLTAVEAQVGPRSFRMTQRVPEPLRGLRHLWENFLARVLLGLRHMSGVEVVPSRVTFVHPAPRSPWVRAELKATFGVQPVFDAPDNRLELPPNMAELRNRTANARIFEVLRRHAEALRPGEGQQPWTTRVAAVLDVGGWDPAPTVERCAATLGTSARTLQRRLREEGSSFELEWQGAAQRRAERALAETNQSIDAIARSLGFATGGSFARAFVRWTGSTPSAYRAARRDHGSRARWRG